MYHDEKTILKNHIMASVGRLMKHGDVAGSATAAQELLNVGVWLDGVETTQRPEPKPKAK